MRSLNNAQSMKISNTRNCGFGPSSRCFSDFQVRRSSASSHPAVRLHSKTYNKSNLIQERLSSKVGRRGSSLVVLGFWGKGNANNVDENSSTNSTTVPITQSSTSAVASSQEDDAGYRAYRYCYEQDLDSTFLTLHVLSVNFPARSSVAELPLACLLVDCAYCDVPGIDSDCRMTILVL